MRLRILLPLSAAFALAAPAAASAAFAHTVAAGESLYSVAAADGISVDQLAAANGLSIDSPLTAGSTLLIPPQASSGPSSAGVATASSAAGATGDGDGDSDDPGTSATTAAGSSSSSSSAGGYVVAPGDTLSAIAARAGVSVAGLAAANGLDPNGTLPAGTRLQLSGGSSSGTAAPASASSNSTPSSATGSYTVQPGDTLSAIAARAGVSVAQLAVTNGLDPNRILPAGTPLQLSGASSSGTGVPVSTSTTSTANADGQPVGAPAQGTASNPPYPTPETVTASQVGQIASANGVSPSLAAAIGYQESGFNNDLVSSADARGVMQILPGTWDWINRTLTAGTPLAPASAAENVRGGVLLLHSLLNSTGGDPALAAAGYYQGLSSVRANGLFSDTQNYVNSVMALRQRFGGG